MSPTPNSVTADLQQANADLQRQLAEARAERDESEAQKAAITEVLGVINSSPGDLAAVFDAMLEKAMWLCEAAFGGLSTWDGERLHRTAWRGFAPEVLQALGGQEPFTPPPGSVGERLARGESIIATADITHDPNFGAPNLQALARVGGARSYVAVALRKDDRYLGNIFIYRQEVRPFTDKQIALLESFAAQAVIAMENARLLTETREALEQQTATAEVLQVINASPGDLAPVFDAILARAHILCDAARGALSLYDGEYFRVVALHGYSEAVAEVVRQPFPGNDFLLQLPGGAPYVHVPDIQAFGSEVTDPVGRAVVESGARTWLGIPLRKESTFLGFISATRTEVRPFTGKQLALLQNFAAQAVIAMENARLITETREALDQQTGTAEVLGVINSSPGDLAPVFDTMLEKALRLCEAAFGTLFIREGDLVRGAATRNLPTALEDYVREPFEPSPTGFFERAAKHWYISGLSNCV